MKNLKERHQKKLKKIKKMNHKKGTLTIYHKRMKFHNRNKEMRPKRKNNTSNGSHGKSTKRRKQVGSNVTVFD